MRTEAPLEAALEQNVKQALTVAAEDRPQLHSGAEFSFELRFG